MTSLDYKNAYMRQKKAREIAEHLLESRSSELYEANQSLHVAYTKLKDQKAQILHQEKLASIGQLSAGVAHEINNPIGYVKSNINSLSLYHETLKKAFDECISNISDKTVVEKISKKYDLNYLLSDLDDVVKDAIEGIDRIEDIVKSLKTFSRPDDGDPSFFCINEAIKNTVKLLNSEIKYKAEIELQLENLPQIRGQQGSFSQVILNLLVNASQAIEDGGRIILRTFVKNNQILIEVQDNGAGIDSDNLVKIFDPFFSTKEVGVGTGLGLSISYGIIKSHGGHIGVTSEKNNGTTFTIYLPVQ